MLYKHEQLSVYSKNQRDNEVENAALPVLNLDKFLEVWKTLWIRDNKQRLEATSTSAMPLILQWYSCQTNPDNSRDIQITIGSNKKDRVIDQSSHSQNLLAAENNLSNQAVFSMLSNPAMNSMISHYDSNPFRIIVDGNTILAKTFPDNYKTLDSDQSHMTFKKDCLVQLQGNITIVFNQKVLLTEFPNQSQEAQTEWQIPIQSIFKDLKEYQKGFRLYDLDLKEVATIDAVNIHTEVVDILFTHTWQQINPAIPLGILPSVDSKNWIKSIPHILKENYRKYLDTSFMKDLQPLMVQFPGENTGSLLKTDTLCHCLETTKAAPHKNGIAMLVGESGHGKSTFARSLMTDWLNHPSGKIQKYGFVFILNGASFCSQNYSQEKLMSLELAELLVETCFACCIPEMLAIQPQLTASHCKVLLSEYVQNRLLDKNENFLIIMDDYDAHEQTDYISAFLDRLIHSQISGVDYLLTANKNHVIAKTLPVIELWGFAGNNLNRYLEKRFPDNIKLQRNLIQNLRKYDTFYSIVKNPVFLDFVCRLWGSDGEQHAPYTQYSWFTESCYLKELLPSLQLSFLNHFRSEYFFMSNLSTEERQLYLWAEMHFLEHYYLVQLLIKKTDTIQTIDTTPSFQYVNQLTGQPFTKSHPLFRNPHMLRHPFLADYYIARILVDFLRKVFQTGTETAHDFSISMQCIHKAYPQIIPRRENVLQFIEYYFVQDKFREPHILALMHGMLEIKPDRSIKKVLSGWDYERRESVVVPVLPLIYRESELIAIFRHYLQQTYYCDFFLNTVGDKLLCKLMYHEKNITDEDIEKRMFCVVDLSEALTVFFSENLYTPTVIQDEEDFESSFVITVSNLQDHHLLKDIFAMKEKINAVQNPLISFDNGAKRDRFFTPGLTNNQKTDEKNIKFSPTCFSGQ